MARTQHVPKVSEEEQGDYEEKSLLFHYEPNNSLKQEFIVNTFSLMHCNIYIKLNV